MLNITVNNARLKTQHIRGNIDKQHPKKVLLILLPNKKGNMEKQTAIPSINK
ncbi:hypothetical protein [Francisella sp. 19X1-34]|uniref:hypothetical protein n=1 Tax=Francisella sp. 19X1-34 TaxID=3087177 RepID=UPI002E2EFAB4|nr:hypothetical protein [Francisella sp. 19X1-34]MED7788857.1 hypothetical protein [Francisella sp. 19X1-34]